MGSVPAISSIVSSGISNRVLSARREHALLVARTSSLNRQMKVKAGSNQSDLTRNDKSKQDRRVPHHQRQHSIEYYDTIFTVMESPVAAGTIWSGSDDGLVYVTRDGGKNWLNVRRERLDAGVDSDQLARRRRVRCRDAYVAATMYKHDDTNLIYRTKTMARPGRDHHRHPDGAFTRVIREDPNKRGLLYAGTETAFTFRLTTANWQSMQFDLPVTPVTDLVIQKRERIGRGHAGDRSGFSTICRCCIIDGCVVASKPRATRAFQTEGSFSHAGWRWISITADGNRRSQSSERSRHLLFAEDEIDNRFGNRIS